MLSIRPWRRVPGRITKRMQRCLTPGVIQAFSMDNTGQRIKPHAAAALLCGSTKMPYKYLFVLQTLHSDKELSTNNTESYTHTHTVFFPLRAIGCHLNLLWNLLWKTLLSLLRAAFCVCFIDPAFLFYASLAYMQPLRFVIRINSCADMLGFLFLFC